MNPGGFRHKVLVNSDVYVWKLGVKGRSGGPLGVAYSSGFLLGFLGLRERLLALQSGQMGALR